MFIPPKIQFYCNSSCQFNCEFCVKSLQDKDFTVDMDMQTFKKYADKCIDFGIRTFELTPIVGEPLLDKKFIERIEYLSPRVDRIIVFTNLYSLDADLVRKLDSFPNLYLYLSIYGNTPEIFSKRTGLDKKHFKTFEKNYNYLAKHLWERECDGFKIGEITYRFTPDTYSTIDFENNVNSITNNLRITNNCSDFYIFKDDYNWKELYSVTDTLDDEPLQREVKGICRNTLSDIGIWPNGDIGLCSGWFDINKRMILGNLNETSLTEIFRKDNKYMQILEEQRNGLYRGLCKYCNYITTNESPFIEEEK